MTPGSPAVTAMGTFALVAPPAQVAESQFPVTPER